MDFASYFLNKALLGTKNYSSEGRGKIPFRWYGVQEKKASRQVRAGGSVSLLQTVDSA
jgi:hypothetical protein